MLKVKPPPTLRKHARTARARRLAQEAYTDQWRERYETLREMVAEAATEAQNALDAHALWRRLASEALQEISRLENGGVP